MAIVLDCFSLGYANLFIHKFTVYDKYQRTTIPTKSELLSLLTLVDNLPGGENLLGGGREGDDLRHGQENLRDEVNFEFQKNSKLLFLSLSSFNLIKLLTCRPAFGIHMHNPPIELDAMDDVVGHILDK